MADSSELSVEIFGGGAADAGFFTWDMGHDLVYGDSALAMLFGLDPYETEHGIPLETYLNRVHPDDRPRLAIAIRDTIVAGQPQQETYRVMNSQNVYGVVTAFGRCFRDRTDNPVLYSGIVVPAISVDSEAAGYAH